MRFAVVQHHDLDHGGQAAPLLLSRGDQGGLHVRRDANADDFGFRDGQETAPVRKTLALCRSMDEACLQDSRAFPDCCHRPAEAATA